MLDADRLAGMRVRPARDIAGGIDAGHAGFEEGVHRDAMIEREAGLLGKPQPGPDTDAGDDKISIERRAALVTDAGGDEERVVRALVERLAWPQG
jgi:hypothetical protein